jgi:acyl-CoA dehydrogenase
MTNSLCHRLTYQAPRRDFDFLLWEQHRLHEAAALDRRAVDALLARVAGFAEGDLATSYRESDEQEAALGDDGRVCTPDSYPALMEKYRAIWNTWQGDGANGGSNGGGHESVQNLVVEMLVGANPSFVTYVGFNGPARNLLGAYASEPLQQTYGPALHSLDASACLCITEKQAGSDLAQLTTWAARGDDGVYRMQGHKWLISAGMHELTGNIYYFVLARTDPAQRGMLGLSCFLVPRFRLDAQGRPTIDNGVRCREVVRKMGLRGCANTHLEFSAGGHETVAFLLGTQEGRGLQQLMMMMAPARISTGIYALGMASCAEGVANRYAQERVQGKRFDQAMSNKADSLPIHQHPDVERMRLDMLAVTGGCRALIARLGVCQFVARSPSSSETQKKEAADLLDLLLPIVKAYTSDQAWRVCENAIQTMGGAGYLREYPVEQNARDCKILSIWEGTNHMQALFLIRDKLGLCLRESKLTTLAAQLSKTLQSLQARGDWEAEIDLATQAMKAAQDAALAIAGSVRVGEMNSVPAYAGDFLFGLAEVAIAWQLLEAADIAAAALVDLETGREQTFYKDKVDAAKYFALRRLPHAIVALDIVRSGLGRAIKEAPSNIVAHD